MGPKEASGQLGANVRTVSTFGFPFTLEPPEAACQFAQQTVGIIACFLITNAGSSGHKGK
jgi:hypothetical protein